MDILDPVARARINFSSYGVTDVGLERKNNEDAFHIEESASLYVVCDGMGGHASGELASRLTVETIVEFVTKTLREPGFRWPYNTPAATTVETRILDSAVRLANRAVHEAALADPRHKGMGTTIVGMIAGPNQLGLVHVGDSRIYRLRGTELTQLTDDHSLLNHYIKTRGLTEEQIRTFKGKNVIVRAIGLRDVVQPEVQVVDVLPGDVLMLCTDGLSDLVSDELIYPQMELGRSNLKGAVDNLIRAALARGGRDNVTVIMALAGDCTGTGAGAAAVEEGVEDTSPGFDTADGAGGWDQETLPAFESALVLPLKAAAPTLSASVGRDTPEALPAVPAVGAGTRENTPHAAFASSPDTKGSPIPPPPRSLTATTEPHAVPAAVRALQMGSPALPARPTSSGDIPPPPEPARSSITPRAITPRAMRSTGVDSKGAAIPLPPGRSSLSVGPSRASDLAAGAPVISPPRSTQAPQSESPFTRSRPTSVPAAKQVSAPPTATKPPRTTPESTDTPLATAVVPAPPPKAATAIVSAPPPPATNVIAPPPLPTAADSKQVKSDLAFDSVGSPVGPPIATAPPSGMPTAPYMAIVVPPKTAGMAAPIIEQATASVDMFNAPTITMPPTNQAPGTTEPLAPTDPSTDE